jgi:hypothetical protein
MENIALIFSYWIFLWYLLYILKLVEYNPKFAILCGLVENLFILILMFYYGTKQNLVLLFLIMMFILKIIPLYSVFYEKIYFKDIVFTFVLFGIYLIWIVLNKKSISDFTRQTMDLILHNKNTFPGMIFLTDNVIPSK